MANNFLGRFSVRQLQTEQGPEKIVSVIIYIKWFSRATGSKICQFLLAANSHSADSDVNQRKYVQTEHFQQRVQLNVHNSNNVKSIITLVEVIS